MCLDLPSVRWRTELNRRGCGSLRFVKSQVLATITRIFCVGKGCRSFPRLMNTLIFV